MSSIYGDSAIAEIIVRKRFGGSKSRSFDLEHNECFARPAAGDEEALIDNNPNTGHRGDISHISDECCNAFRKTWILESLRCRCVSRFNRNKFNEQHFYMSFFQKSFHPHVR